MIQGKASISKSKRGNQVRGVLTACFIFYSCENVFWVMLELLKI